MQKNYRIIVAESLEKLASENFIWDSEKIASDSSVNVEYEGPTPKSAQSFFGKVCVWINEKEFAWSKPAFWEMGLLKNSDWKAEFIHPLIEEDISKACPSPVLRKEFSLNKKKICKNLRYKSWAL